jgi:hypothetical protein
MLAVVVCNLASVAMLVGLLAGIVAGVVRARVRVGEALAYAPLAVRPAAEPAEAARRARWQPA